ncbi:atlastin-1-like [Hyalella azteca]|uniref:Atlastin-1-like n=1 Tax=Hyalella azteca TaxID=294128 RepID=A0A8B7NTG8_HYAAZ|nr:atlastin-1-like [Hyalella azteca]
MSGHPVPIVVQNKETREFELDEEALRGVLLRPEVGDKPVCVVAVAGAFRTGKSFLLNFLVKYCVNEGSPNWLGDPSQPLDGFVWSSGMEGQTAGIYIWSKPFTIYAKSSGKKVAVILMDTQGTFDTQTSLRDSTYIFALTLLTSSVTVYNLMNNIREDDLTNLQTFSTYGASAQKEIKESRAFQNLLFLVRDWSFPRQHPCGHEGGQVVLEKVLGQLGEKAEKPMQASTHQRLMRQGLRQSFEKLECYLMPHIGLGAAEDSNFDGRPNQLSPQFVEHIKLLVPRLLAPERLVVKRSAARRGQPATGEELVDFIKTYMAVFREGKLVEPTSLAEMTARVCSNGARNIALEVYKNAMNSIVNPDEKSYETTLLSKQHLAYKRDAVAAYLRENQYAASSELFPVVHEVKEQLEKVSECMREVTPYATEFLLQSKNCHFKTYIILPINPDYFTIPI